MADTLVLNKDGQPVSLLPPSTIQWKEAITYLWLDKVHVLEWYDDWVVSSPSWETKVPAVVLVKKYIKKNTSVRLSRFNVLLRDSFECQYCDDILTRSDATLDHVIPRSLGGKTSWTNIVASCGSCNVLKGNKISMKPRNYPYKPTYYDLIKNKELLDISVRHESWNNFIFK